MADILEPSVLDDNARLSLSNRTSYLSTPSSILNDRQQSAFRRKRFDDRSQSRTSIQLRAHTASPNTTRPLVLHEASSEGVQHFVKWIETRQILKIINSSAFLEKFGAPQLIELSQHHIAVGTEKGVIVAFNYKQEADFVLVPRKSDIVTPDQQPISQLCCISFSSDAFYAAAGYRDGSIAVWDLETAVLRSNFDVIYADGLIEPISIEQRFGRNVQGHLRDVPVVKIDFVGDQDHQIVSSDLSGLLFFHRGFKRFLRKYHTSQKLLGKNDTNADDPSGKFTLHDSQMLPIGTSEQLTDTLGLLAVITKNILMIVSVRSLDNPEAPHPISHFKCSRPKHVAGDEPNACLSWYPCIEVEKKIQNAKLAYAWDNIILIVELDNEAIPGNIMSKIAEMKEKNKGIPQFIFHKKGRLSVPQGEKVVTLNWLNSEILTAVTHQSDSTETKLYFFYYNGKNNQSTFTQVGVDNLDSQQVSTQSLNLLPTKQSPITISYSGSLKILRHRFVLLVNSHSASQKSILSGRCLKWADRLTEYLAHGEFQAALNMAHEYYVSENYGQLVLHGLPHNVKERHSVVEPILKRVMSESIVPLFDSESSEYSMEANLRLYFTLSSILSKGDLVTLFFLDMLDEVYERFENHGVFFEILEEYIVASEIKNLSPILFKGLIEYYAASDKREVLAELICLLDLSTLNIDLALSLCKKFQLRECRIYIWNEMLKDYTAPLVSLIEEIDSASDEHDELVIVYTYMSYVLTGRQYPNDKVVSSDIEEHARSSICNILFNIGPFIWPPNSEKTLLGSKSERVFPYLTFFLEFDTFETLVTINEFFENPALNDETNTLNRQYIVEALLDIFDANQNLQDSESRTHLAIFIARNYPKYFQFIRLSETVLQDTVDYLCKNRNEEIHEDCELALESLLSVYEVESDAHLLEQMRAAKFYDVLFRVFKAQGKYTQAMEMWLAKSEDSSSPDTKRNFIVLADMLKITFQVDGQNTTEQFHLTRFIEDHFTELLSLNAADMVVLSNTYRPSLHLLVLSCNDELLALNYLESYFERSASSDMDSITLPLLVRYVELLSTYKKEEVKLVVTKYVGRLAKCDKEKSEIKKSLESVGLYELLAIVLKQDGEYEAAVNELCNAISALQKESLTDTLYTQIETYLNMTISASKEARQEGLWTSLVGKIVGMSEQTEDQRLHEIFNETIFKCFRAIEDTEGAADHKSIFANVFNQVLEVAKVANIRETLQDILTSYFFEAEIHTITVGKINQRISKYMDTIRQEELLGWLVSNKHCTSCGKLMWGGETQERHAWAWEEKQKSKVFLSDGPFEAEKFSDCNLYLFKCSHGYHKKCLEQIGGTNRCVICCPE